MRWWQRNKRIADLERELQSDLELEEEEQRDRGLSRQEARSAALRAFGNKGLIRERTHEAWRWAGLEQLRQDIGYGLRQLSRNRRFAVVAVATLALGIAINSTIFSAVSALLLRKPPVSNPDTLCAISSRDPGNRNDLVRVSAPDFLSWQKENHVFDHLAAIERSRPFTLTGRGEPEVVHADLVTSDYFSMTGATPSLGRTFLVNESHPGEDHVVILSSALWRDRFHSDPSVVGKDLDIDGEPYGIVGVMPPTANITTRSRPQLWMPLSFSAEDLSPQARGNHYIDLVLGRLRDGVTIQMAQAEMDSIVMRLSQTYPLTNKGWGVTVLTLQEHNVRSEDVRNAMLLLMTAVGLILLLACTNIAGLLLTRGAVRAHELAVRSALGASRMRLLRQALTESLLIGVAGGVAGLLLSFWGIQFLRAGFNFNEAGRQMGAELRIDPPTMLYTLAIALLATIAFGLLPAVRSSNASPQGALSQSGRAGSMSLSANRLRKIMVAGEVALAILLLAAAGVDMREVLRELNSPNGFNPQNLLVTKLDVGSRQYERLEARTAFFQQVTQALRGLPDVEAVEMDSCVPMNCYFSAAFEIAGRPAQSATARPSADFSIIGPDYFRTMQIPVMRGRIFSDADRAGEPVVAIINEEFARRYFPNESALGKTVEVEDGNHKRAQIVGIVGNVNRSVGQIHPHAQIYESYLQVPVNAFSSMSLIVRSRVPAATIATSLRRAVRAADSRQPATLLTMGQLFDDNLGGDKLLLGLMTVFGSLALVLAGVGIYGVIAYSVTQRTREIGIRIALGAIKRDVLELVLREGAMLTGLGCAIGMIPALMLPKLFSGLLNGFAPQDSLVAIAAVLVVGAVAWVATYVPALRATRLDPVHALRAE
jgi:putative ABC transport system permease protein